MKFWLGLHHASWVTQTDVPSMLSYRTLYRRKSLPRALGGWVQDSGGFTELSLHGAYQTAPRVYAERTRLHAQQIGQLEWAAIQDWMCEDLVLGKTGLDVAEHQRRTVQSLLDLRELAPEMPWLPVLQGRELEDYLRHIELYAAAGVDVAALPLVGMGTVCRRQHTMVAVRLIQGVASQGVKLHGFGLKVTSVLRSSQYLASCDSMAWSLDGRLPKGGRCKRERDHAKCGNCLDYAHLWRQRLLDRMSQGVLL